MIVGIVSKHDHAKAHAAGLEADGHTVKILGSDGNIVFPDDLDVLVLRWQSASHGALERGRAWAKAHHVPTVAENGLSGIRMALNALRPKSVKDTVLLAPQPQPPVEIVVDDNEALRNAVLSAAKPSSFVKNLLAGCKDKPARFLYLCMRAFEGQAIPKLYMFVALWRRIYPNDTFHEGTLVAFYEAGCSILSRSSEARQALRNAFMRGDSGAGKFFDYPLDPDIASLKGRGTAYLAYFMWLLDGLNPKRASVAKHAYAELSGATQADPRCFAMFRDHFGFEMSYSRGPLAETPIAETPIVSTPVHSEESKPGVWASIQEEVINLAIRMESLSSLASKLESVDTDVGECEVALTKCESGIEAVRKDMDSRTSDLEIKYTHLAGRLDGCYQSYYKADARTDKVLAALDTYRARIEDLEQANKQLSARLDEALAALEAFKTPAPAVGLEAALTLLKGLGAEVQIRL